MFYRSGNKGLKNGQIIRKLKEGEFVNETVKKEYMTIIKSATFSKVLDTAAEPIKNAIPKKDGVFIHNLKTTLKPK